MTTRAQQFDVLRAPVIDYRDGSVAAGFVVYFYEGGGTSTSKSVWTEKEKTNSYTTRTLGSDGTVTVYGDGVYRLAIYDGDTLVYDWDNIKCQATTYTVEAKSGDYTATPDDDFIKVDTSSDDVTISIQTVANFERPLTFKNVGGGAGNSLIIDPYSTETIDGDSTYTITGDKESITLYPDTASSTWRKGESKALYNLHLGGLNRPQFTWNSTSNIVVGAGSYDVDGKLARFNSTVATAAISSGGTDWHYLYIDYSGVPSNAIMVSTAMYWSSSEPSFSGTKLGYYHGSNTSDRCIFAVYTYSDDILEFWHNGNYVSFAVSVSVQGETDYDTTFTDSSAFRVPVFAERVDTRVTLDAAGSTNSAFGYWRPNGSTATGNQIGQSIQDADGEFSDYTISQTMIVGTDDKVELKYSSAGDHKMGVYQDGWYLGRGM